MPVIRPLMWDSRQLGVPVGKLEDFAADLADPELEAYRLVLARVPQQHLDVVAKLQAGDFRYIGLDLRLAAEPEEPSQTGDSHWRIRRISHCNPDFLITGFHIEDSRLMLDPACRVRLPMDFWDRLVYEHCTEFADTVICAVDANNHLAGFVSCLTRPSHLDLFMVAVHTSHQGGGLGGALVRDAAALARERGLRLNTSVMASNIRGFNFYIRHNFIVESGEIVMHRWQEGG
jgi:ribosomal protein S18 acetylase RimI-like enzyme